MIEYYVIKMNNCVEEVPLTLLPWNRMRCLCVSSYVTFQCIVVFFFSYTVLHCLWKPEMSSGDWGRLTRIMYLFDYEACGRKLRRAAAITNLVLGFNETQNVDLLPIKWVPAAVTVSTRLSAKTRRYIELSIAVHIIWMTSAILLWIFTRRQSTSLRYLKLVLSTFFYCSVMVVIFDVSMGIVYVAHIQQSLTKGMILRYSGWNVEIKLSSADDFAGWIPMFASACWLRGIFFLTLNICCCSIIRSIRYQIQKREVKRRLITEGQTTIPEPRPLSEMKDKVLYFRAGDIKPQHVTKMRL